MRGQGGKKDEIKLHDSKWVNDLYKKLLEDGEIKMQINQNHIHFLYLYILYLLGLVLYLH